MADTWVTDLTHFLTGKGEIGPKSGPARKLAEYFTEIVVDATTEPWEETGKKPVRCRRRPGRRRCAGVIGADIDPDTDAVMWWCPLCGDKGSITKLARFTLGPGD
jgi:predicted RNA-binding Zn-ribbon protein involved in translation (DUF1610 family)